MKAIKLVVYVILSVLVVYFGSAFFKEYNQLTEQSAARGDYDIDEVETPVYEVGTAETPKASETTEPSDGEFPEETEAPTDDPTQVSPDTADSDDAGNAETNKVASASETSTTSSNDSSDHTNRIGFYIGGFVLSLLALGLLAGYDLTRYSANRTLDSIYNDDGVGTDGYDLYESAEQEWARGDFLEAVRLLREYLKVQPKQQHAAIRIAEIYEKDLKNPLAAALEYEEILQQKLSPDRWGWAAIHLANLYSGPMGKPEKAIELLRQLVEKYPETPAAEKASQRLARIDEAE